MSHVTLMKDLGTQVRVMTFESYKESCHSDEEPEDAWWNHLVRWAETSERSWCLAALSAGVYSLYVCHDSFICDMTHSCVPWLIHVGYESLSDHGVPLIGQQVFISCMCAMTHSYVTRHDSFICVSPVAWSAGVYSLHLWRDLFICAVTHSCVKWVFERSWSPAALSAGVYSLYLCHDSFICAVTHSCVPWLIHMWRDPFICDLLWLFCMKHVMTHSYVWVPLLYQQVFIACMCAMTHSWVTWPIHMWLAMTHSYEIRHDSFICVSPVAFISRCI